LKKQIILNISLILCLLMGYSSLAKAQKVKNDPPPPTLNQLWHTREHFVYSVKYSFFHLGNITLDVMPDTLYDGKERRYVRVTMKSNSGLPFIGNELDIFSSIIARNDTMMYDLYYWKDDIDKGVKKEVQYTLDYNKHKVYVYNKDKDNKGKRRDTLSLSQPSFCGMAFFFYPRLFAGTNHFIKVPVYVSQKKSYITMKNIPKEEMIDSDAFPDGHVMTYKSTGTAYFDGPLGFNGDYTAWYAAGPMRIPVQAYVRVWLGNVKIRLKKYSIIK